MGLGEAVVGEDHGMKGVSGREAGFLAEVGGPGGGGEIPGFQDGKEIGLPIVQDTAGLGSTDGSGGNVKHIQPVAA